MRVCAQEADAFREVGGVFVWIVQYGDMVRLVVCKDVWVDRVEVAEDAGWQLRVRLVTLQMFGFWGGGGGKERTSMFSILRDFMRS